MTRTERLNLKKKLKRATTMSVVMIGLFILNIVLLVTIDWRPQAMSEPTESSDLLLVMFVMIILMVPLFLAFHFNVRSTWYIKDLYNVRREINKERNKMYVRRVFDFVQKEEFEKAINVHNDFVFGSAKVITRGVLIGALFFKGGNEDHKRAILNMNGIVDEEM